LLQNGILHFVFNLALKGLKEKLKTLKITGPVFPFFVFMISSLSSIQSHNEAKLLF